MSKEPGWTDHFQFSDTHTHTHTHINEEENQRRTEKDAMIKKKIKKLKDRQIKQRRNIALKLAKKKKTFFTDWKFKKPNKNSLRNPPSPKKQFFSKVRYKRKLNSFSERLNLGKSLSSSKIFNYQTTSIRIFLF